MCYAIYMQADYRKLWKLLIDKNMKKTDLIPIAGVSTNIVAKLNKGEYVSMDSLAKICKALLESGGNRHLESGRINQF